MSLFDRFKNPFYQRKYSMAELRKYGAAQLAALVADTPAGFSTVVADLTSCLAAFDAVMPEVIGAEGARAEAVANKKAFRKALAPKITRIYSAIAAAYGDPSAELDGAFPHGRSVFARCEEVDLLGHLTALKNWFTPAHETAVGTAHKTAATGLVTQWTALFAAGTAAGGALSSDRDTRDEAKTHFQDCLFTVLLSLALKFPNDEAKFNQYVPEHLLEDVGTAPPKPNFDCTYDEDTGKPRAEMDSAGAASFILQRSTDGGVTFNTIIEGVTTSPFYIDDQAPGTYHYRVIAVGANGLESEPSDDVEVIVPAP